MRRPLLRVIVAPDGKQRRHGGKLIENLGRPDVSAMNDVIAADGECPRFGSHQPMGVRQQCNTQCVFHETLHSLALHRLNMSRGYPMIRFSAIRLSAPAASPSP